MAKGDHSFRRKPKGAVGGGYRRPRVQVGFDKHIIKIVSERAKENGHSFAAEVRDLVNRGLAGFSLTR